MSNESPTTATDGEVLSLLGRRLRALRETQQLTSSEAATQSGLSRRTVYRAEQGQNPTLQTVVRLLRLYGRIAAITGLVPEPELSPMALVRQGSEQRKRRSRG